MFIRLNILKMDNNFIRMDKEQESRLKQFRIYMNMTQQQMADLLNVGQNTYSRIENGITAFKDVYKKIIEDKYHLTTGWLSGADVPMLKKYDAVAGIIGKSIPESNRDQLKEQILEELVTQRLEGKNESISMSREVFEQISRLTETVLSQQKTIESMQEQNRKFLVQQGEDVRCAHVSGSDISTNDIKNQNINKE